ncbi:MAG: hypothetical protein ACUVUG_09090 [Candidatus Aminicenantia bacterium]
MSFSLIIILLFSQRFLLDKIVATVDTDIITLRELKTSYLLHICNISKNDHLSIRNCLDELINYKVIQKEITQQREEIRKEDYISEEERIIKELGGLDEVLEILADLDMSWEEFREILTIKIIATKLIENLFYSRVSVTISEIEDYYNKNYVPAMKKLGINPRSLIEMTPYIEKEIAKDKSQDIINSWLKERKEFHQVKITITDEDIKFIVRDLRKFDKSLLK